MASLVVVSGCSNDRPFGLLTPHGGSGPITPRAFFDCVGTAPRGTTASSVSCAPADPNGPAAAADPNVRAAITRDIIVGRQNVDVMLSFSSFVYTPAKPGKPATLAFNAALQNLLNQPLGATAQDTAATNGTRVFFLNNPPIAVTRGSGLARDSNPDGYWTFTSGLQPYYKFAGIIAPKSTGASKQWIIALDSTVVGFTFSVEVDAPLPAEKSIRRWVTLRQGVTSNDLTATWRHNANDGYAVGLNGAILQYNGATWGAVGGSLPAANYRSVSGVAAQAVASVWAVGDNGAVAHDTAGTWTSVGSGQSNTLRGVWVAGAGNVFAVGSNATILHFNGSTWATMAAPGGTRTLRAIWGTDASHIWAVGDRGVILFYDGTSWTAQTSGTNVTLNGVWGDAATDVFAVGAGGTILHFSGGSWSAQTSNTTNNLTAIGGNSATDIWAVGDIGTTLHYTGTWAVVGPHTGIPLAGVTAGSAAPWAVGVSGSLLAYTGTVWHLSTQSGITFNSVWASSPSDVYASALGTVVHYDGNNWTNAYVSPADSMLSIWGAGAQPSPVLTVGAFGDAATLASGTWTTQTYGVGLFSVWGTAANNVYAGATFGIVGYFDGSTVSSFDLGTFANVQSVWGSSATDVYAAANDGTIYHYVGSGGNWTSMSVPGGTPALYALAGGSSSDVYAVGANGTVLRNTGGGSGTWASQASGTTSNLWGAWAAAPAFPYKADAYAVGDNGVVQHYNGVQWLNMPTGVSTTLRGVFGTSATNIYVVGANGVLLLGTQ